MFTKKIIIIALIVFGLAMVTLVYLGNLWFSRTTAQVAKSFRNTALENNWANEKDIPSIDLKNDSVGVIKKSQSLIFYGATKKAQLIGYKENGLVDSQKTTTELIKGGSYYQALKEISKEIKLLNVAANKYKREHSSDLKNIERTIETRLEEYLKAGGFKVANYKIMNEWALATVIPINIKTDPANVVLKKTGDTWTIISGPMTYFDETDLENLGAPQEVIDSANIIVTNDVLK